MPIKNLYKNGHRAAEFSIGRDVELSFCSDSCLLRTLDDGARVVRTGQAEATALTVIVHDNHLLVPILGTKRERAHVLGSQDGMSSARANWEKIVGHDNLALMPVYRVCDCMAEVQIVDGEPFEDAATTPSWKKVRGIVAKSPVFKLKGQLVEFDQWRIWMASLAHGLDALENLGLAHGDPYPFNCVSTATDATWVDFGQLTDDPNQYVKDAWAFVLFTVLHTLRLSASYSSELLKDLALVMLDADRPGRFDRIRRVFLAGYQDAVYPGDVRIPSLEFAEAIAEFGRSHLDNLEVSKFLLKASIQYFSDSLHHIQRGNHFFRALSFEQQRHHFYEQEMARLTVPRAVHTDKLDSLNQVVANREVKIVELTQELVERDRQIVEINQSLSERKAQIVELNKFVAEQDTRFADINTKLADLEERVLQLNYLLGEREIDNNSLKSELFKENSKNAELQELLTDRETLVESLNKAIEAHKLYTIQLSESASSSHENFVRLINSRSWRITRPFRVLARIVKQRGIANSDKLKIYNYAKSIHHRIPISYSSKLAVKKILKTVIGLGSQNFSAVGSSNMVSVIDCRPEKVKEVLSPQKISCSVNSADMRLNFQTGESNAVPYFGVRQPEGRRRVAILTNQLLDWNDGRPRFGGGERYALELARLLKELRFDVTFYQPSFRAPGESEYYGFKVVLLNTAESIGEFHYGLCSKFTELTKDFDHVYYHLPEYASGHVREDGLMTCHGIWFDHNNYPNSIFRTPEWFQQLHWAFSNPRCVISVDTNSIGVIRSLWPNLAKKMRFIPNFYDANAYFPQPELRDPKRLTVLFPRRSQINRGSRIFGEIVSLIPHDVQIIWLGEGDPVDTQIIKDVCKKDRRVSFAVAEFDQMPQWYQKADIAVIPTIACEGTSLSCIEALAVGCAVVSTNVGGLPDLVYDGLNGLLVDPEPRSIALAVNRLIVDRELRERLQKSAYETSSHFELKKWRERWGDVLNDYGWITDKAHQAWKKMQGDSEWEGGDYQSDKWLILTRNAIHGGVESLIREEAKGLNAPVVVCGGHDQKETCPFEYTRADSPSVLERVIEKYDVILYHWLPEWCLEVLRQSGKRCIEFVHRTDTAESDKTLPTGLVTHSAFLARYINATSGRSCRVVDHPIAIDRFVPRKQKGKFVGAITSYYDTKGIDIFLHAWAQIKDRYLDIGVRFYGAGDDLPKLRKLANELVIDADFRDATKEPWEAMADFACFVVPSRIEGLPVAILEALAMNIPVVSSDLPGMVEFNQLAESRGYSGFVNLAKTEDVNDLARVISDTLENSGLCNSNAYIRDYYSPQKHCADLVSIYKELCH